VDELEELLENLNDQIDYYKKSAQQWSEIATQCLSKMTEFSAAGVAPDLMWCFEINERMREARKRLLKDLDLI
jgi:hypothetical protein